MLESLFHKVEGLLGLQHIYSNKENPTQAFTCEYCEIFINTFFYRIPPVAASGSCKVTNDSSRLDGIHLIYVGV